MLSSGGRNGNFHPCLKTPSRPALRNRPSGGVRSLPPGSPQRKQHWLLSAPGLLPAKLRPHKMEKLRHAWPEPCLQPEAPSPVEVQVTPPPAFSKEVGAGCCGEDVSGSAGPGWPGAGLGGPHLRTTSFSAPPQLLPALPGSALARSLGALRGTHSHSTPPPRLALVGFQTAGGHEDGPCAGAHTHTHTSSWRH